MANRSSKWLVKPLIAALSAVLAAGPVAADAQVSRSDHRPLREAMQRADVLPLSRIIESATETEPYSSMRFLGVVGLDPIRMRYKLKFMDGDRVVFVYVDARSGRVLGHTR